MAIEKRIGAYSAYAIAIENGFEGTEEEWLESLIGPRGYQGWGVSAISVSADGSLIFTIKNPETGETRELEPIQIETLNALNSISTAKDEALDAITEAQTQATEAVGTAKTQAVQAVEDAENTGVSAVEDAKSNALTEVGKAKTTAVDAVNAAGTQAASDAQTAITAAKNQAVSDVQNAGQSAVEKVQEAQTAGVQAVEDAQADAVKAVQDAGTAEVEKISNLLPVPTADDAGKVPVAKPDGSGYELGKAGVQIDDTKTALDTTWSSENIVSRICPPFEVSGSIVTCNPVKGSPLNVLVQIEPVQEGEGDPSPENVRPIRGYEKATLWAGGVNLLSDVNFQNSENNGITYTKIGNGIIHVEGTATGSSQSNAVNDVPQLPPGTYYGIVNADLPGLYVVVKKAGSESKEYYDILKASLKIEAGDTILYYYITVGSGKTVNTDVYIFLANEQTEFVPYNPDSKTVVIPIGQTVYGGMLDVTTGVLTKTHENIPSYAGENVGDDWISSTGSLTDGAQVVYRLPQSEILQLDPVEIAAFSGVNTVYADTGDVTVSGYSDPNTIINALTKRISALEQNAIGG